MDIKIIFIAAVSQNNIICVDGKMPWHVPEELSFFKNETTPRAIVYGRKTFDSLDRRPLSNRTNYIISSNKNLRKKEFMLLEV